MSSGGRESRDDKTYSADGNRLVAITAKGFKVQFAIERDMGKGPIKASQLVLFEYGKTTVTNLFGDMTVTGFFK